MNDHWALTHRRADQPPRAHIAGTLYDIDISALALRITALARDGALRADVARAVNPLRGRFAIVASDPRRDRVVGVRDHLGLHPLFYAMSAAGETHFANAVDALLALPGVSPALNRPVLAEHLMHRWVDPEETYYAAIRRVPPGHFVDITNGRPTLWRYWDPAACAPTADADAVPRFNELFDRAVARVANRRSAVFLSGGFDSVSIAAAAAAKARRDQTPMPFALSLSFESADCDESAVQAGVARQLGIDLALVTLQDAVEGRGVLTAALKIGAEWPQPLVNIWTPAYEFLARTARPADCQAILSGTGGDEWMNVTPYFFADLIRGGRIREIAALGKMFRQSFAIGHLRLLRNVWQFGARPLGSEALAVVAPRAWHRQRHRTLVRSIPDWIAPDPPLRAEVEARAERMILPARPGRAGFYGRELQLSLRHTLVTMEMEEHFEFGRRNDVTLCHPYLDTDLVELLYGLSPRALTLGGRTKGLIRQAIASRFPALGFERQKKVDATNFSRAMLRREGAQAWAATNGLTSLTTLGVVDPARVAPMVADLLRGQQPARNYLIWTTLNLETWARTHT